MANKSNRYRAGSERSRQRGKGTAKRARPDGHFGLFRRAAGAARGRVHGPHWRREGLIIGALSLAIVVGLGSLGLGLYLSKADNDWVSVASVNGHSISREDLRGRMAVLSLLAGVRERFIDLAGGRLTSAQAATLDTEAASETSVEAARESLIDDELLRQLAARQGVATPASPDPWAEASAYATGDLAHLVRYIRFGLADASASAGPSASASPSASPSPSPSPTPPPAASNSTDSWPAASEADVDATIARVRAELSADTPVATITADLKNAGWVVFGQDVLVSSDGVPADSSVALDSTIAADTIAGKPGNIVGPTTDSYGQTNIGYLLAPPDGSMISQWLQTNADKDKVDVAAVRSWANGQALRRAMTDNLTLGWRSKPQTQAHFRELVIGAAPDSGATAGPWVELSVLLVDRLNGVAPSSISGAPSGLTLSPDALAKTLKSMTLGARLTLFRGLVSAANRPAGLTQSSTSGEIGFYTADGLAPDLGKAAFATTTRTGDVMGPISTPAGSALYLVETRYAGALDTRSQTALGQIRSDPTANLLTYTQTYSPSDAALAIDAGWRAEAEFGSDEAVHSALFDTPIGVLSDPFVLDGKLALASVTDRRTALPDARMLDRLRLDGYNVWFASQYAAAIITETAHPLPELEPSSSPSASASTSTGPVLPSAPALDTPNLPAIPGASAATPVPTDAMGLPEVP